MPPGISSASTWRDVLERLGWHAVAEALELLDQPGREHARPTGDELPELDERRTEADEEPAQPRGERIDAPERRGADRDADPGEDGQRVRERPQLGVGGSRRPASATQARWWSRPSSHAGGRHGAVEVGEHVALAPVEAAVHRTWQFSTSWLHPRS